jgi:hypothetical protein
VKVRTTTAGRGLSASLGVVACGSLTVFASAAVSACTTSSPSTTLPTFSPAKSSPATSTALPGGTAKVATPSASHSSGSASPPTAQSPSGRPIPTAAPATGGGGTAGFQDPLLFGLGGAAILAGAGSLTYRRKVIRNR